MISESEGQSGSGELRCSLSAAGDRRRSMQPFVPRVAQGQGNPRVQKPVSNFGNGLYIFNFRHCSDSFKVRPVSYFGLRQGNECSDTDCRGSHLTHQGGDDDEQNSNIICNIKCEPFFPGEFLDILTFVGT